MAFKRGPLLIALCAASAVAAALAWGLSAPGRDSLEAWKKPRSRTFAEIDAFLERRRLRNAPLTRRLADDGSGTCLRDRVSSARISQEIAALESSWEGDGKAADWFLEVGENFIDADALDPPPAVECAKSPACLIQSLYERTYSAEGLPAPRGDEGSRIYHWALLNRSFLACSTRVPLMKRFDRPLSEMLFSAAELEVFSEIAVRIPSSYRDLWAYRSLHKMPKGTKLGGIANASPGSMSRTTETTRDSRGRTTRSVRFDHEPGRIRFSASGLRLSKAEGRLTYDVSLRETAVHEMSHILDYELGVPARRFSRFSYTDLWKDLSGWRMTSSRDERGVIRYGWKYEPSMESQFVRWYAKTNPQEDFADTAAFYLMDPSKLKGAPAKNSVVREWVFGGREYTAEGLIRYYRAEIESALLSSLADTVSRCVSGAASAAEPPAVYVKTLPGASRRNSTVERCLANAFNARVHEAVLSLRANDWNACDTLAGRALETVVRAEAATWDERVSSLLADDDPVAAVEDARAWTASVSSEFDKREIYVACRAAEDPETCYADRVNRSLADLADRAPARVSGFADRMVAYWRNRSSFESARRSAVQTVDRLLAAIDQDVLSGADAVWKRCLSAANANNQGMSLEPFDGGARFVRPAILGCVNEQTSEAARSILAARSRGEIKWDSEAALALAQERVVARLVYEFDGLAEADARKEDSAWGKAYDQALQGKTRPTEGCADEIERQLVADFAASPAARLGRDFSRPVQRMREWALRFCGVAAADASGEEAEE